MARIEKTIFISYRRKDISWALAVYQYLTGQKYNVFFDYRSIPSGDFEQIIISNIKARAHFVLILTPTALDRCDDPEDWLRREIETAIDERRNIIPLFFEGFSFGTPSVAGKLTGKLAAIRRYNGLDIPSGYFLEAMERLDERYLSVPLDAVLHPVPTEVRTAVKQEQQAVNDALVQNRENIEALMKPAAEPPAQQGQTQNGTSAGTPFLPSKWMGGESGKDKLRVYGIGAGILLAVALGLAGINLWLQNRGSNAPVTMTGPVVTNTKNVEASSTAPFETATEKVLSTEPVMTVRTEEPTMTLTPPPTLGIGSMKVSEKDGMTLLYVPAGPFTMGSSAADAFALCREVSTDCKLEDFKDEDPPHTVDLDAFWIDQTEVTNAMYAQCVEAGGCTKEPASIKSSTDNTYYKNPEKGAYPVINVSWDAANAYCKWAGRQLPTEAQWEKAARGDDERPYPWGTGVPNNDLLNFNSQVQDTTKVGSYPDGASPYGVMDMAGNVWDWVADRYNAGYYARSRSSNPPGPNTGTARVLRGGAWSYSPKFASTTYRVKLDPSFTSYDIGFRCAQTP